MPRRICIIHGHPDPAPGHFTAALSDAYAAAATAAGHEVSRIDIAALDVPLLRAPSDFAAPPPPQIRDAQAKVTAAEHVVVVFPMWLGGMPALARAFFEQLSRAGFALGVAAQGWPKGMLAGRSARVVVSMGMPSAAYRMLFGAHGVRGFERSVLALAGFKPIRETLFGMIEATGPEGRARMLAKMTRLGRLGG
jgi:putative NADPH-quinone reductase